MNLLRSTRRLLTSTPLTTSILIPAPLAVRSSPFSTKPDSDLPPVSVTPLTIKPRNWRDIEEQNKMQQYYIDRTKGYDPAYQLRVGVFVERIFKVLPRPPEWQVRYDHYKIAKKRELFSIFPAEMREPDDGESPYKVTIPMETEADKQNDRKSMDRKITESLYLLVKSKDGKWTFPEWEFDAQKDKNSLRLCAEKNLDKTIGPSFKSHVLSSSPCGHIEMTYQAPKGAFIGSRTFFLHSVYLKGQMKLDSALYSDYLWVTKDEMKEYLSPQLMDLASDCLIPTGFEPDVEAVIKEQDMKAEAAKQSQSQNKKDGKPAAQ